MSIITDIKGFWDFKKILAGGTTTSNNPLVHLFGHEKTYGKAQPHDYKNFVANFNSWAFACGYRNGFSVAEVPLRLYVGQDAEDPNKRLVDEEHPFKSLMKNVNLHYNRTELMVLTTIFQEVTGNAYWWIAQDELGVPGAIWPLPAHWISVVPDKDRFIKGYVMTVPGKGEKVFFPAEVIIHFKFPSIFSIFYGAPTMYGASYDIDLNKHQKEHGINYFMNNAQPGGVLQTEQRLPAEVIKRLREQWAMRHQGTKNAGKMAVLEAGLKYTKTGSDMKEMRFDSISTTIRDGILAAFGVPASKLGLVEDVNRANADANDYTYQKNTIKPRLTLIEEKLNEKMMPFYGENIFVAFDDNVPKDREFVLKKQTESVRAGIRSIDEVREEQGLKPLGLPETIVPLIPMSLRPAGEEAEEVPPQLQDPEPEPKPKPPKPGDKPKKSLVSKASRRKVKWEMFILVTGPQEKLFAKTMQRFFAKQRHDVMVNLNKFRAAGTTHTKEGFEANILFVMQDQVDKLAHIAKPHVEAAYKSGIEFGYDELGATLDFTLLTPDIIRAVDQRIAGFAWKVNETTVKLITEEMNLALDLGEPISDIAKRLDKIYDFSENHRSKTTAQTEVIGGANAGQLNAYMKNGVENKEWLTARDERVRQSHLTMDGQTVGITESFTTGAGSRLQYPGDRTGAAPAGEVINCRCTVQPAFKKE